MKRRLRILRILRELRTPRRLREPRDERGQGFREMDRVGAGRFRASVKP
jgi:hypothetical protein